MQEPQRPSPLQYGRPCPHSTPRSMRGRAHGHALTRHTQRRAHAHAHPTLGREHRLFLAAAGIYSTQRTKGHTAGSTEPGGPRLLPPRGADRCKLRHYTNRSWLPGWDANGMLAGREKGRPGRSITRQDVGPRATFKREIVISPTVRSGVDGRGTI
jgi:hypothetical protein